MRRQALKKKLEKILDKYLSEMKETSVLANPLIISAINDTKGEIALKNCDIYDRLLGGYEFAKNRCFGERLKKNRQRSYHTKLAYEVAGGKNPGKFLPIAAAMDIIDSGCYYSADDIIDFDVKTLDAIRDKLVFSHIYRSAATKLVLDGMENLDLPSSLIKTIWKDWNKFIRWTFEGFYIEYHKPQKDTQIYANRLRAYGFWEFSFKIASLAAKNIDKSEVLSEAGKYLGMAYMMTDDILDIGKRFSDIKNGIYTLPIMEFIERADKKERALLDKCFGNLEAKEEDLFEIGKIMVNKDIINNCLEKGVSDLVYKFFNCLKGFSNPRKIMLMYTTHVLYKNKIYKVLREKYGYKRTAKIPFDEEVKKNPSLMRKLKRILEC